MSIEFKQGEDLIIQIPVYNKANERVVLTDAIKIRVAFLIKRLTAQKYLDDSRESAISGYSKVIINATDPTILDVYVTREDSKGFPIGELTAQILVEFPDIELDKIAHEYSSVIGSVTQGYLKDEDLSV